MKKKRILKSIISLVLVGSIFISQSSQVEAVRSISAIQKAQKALQAEIDDIDSELYEVVSEIAALQAEIESTMLEIEETEQALADCTEACEEQYASMKVRIQYMYESQSESVMTMLLGAGGFSEFLNRLEYVNGIYAYDDEKMEQLEAIQQEIIELGEALEFQREQLEAQNATMKSKEANLSAVLDKKKGEMKNLDAELKKAKEIAAREAALRAARAAKAKAADKNHNVNGDLNPEKTTNISGSDVVAYANQFVGNPYVWGGTSLTNGCDCSGFIMSVYKNFGISFGGSRVTSAGLRSVGKEVSYNHMQAGDIVCYAGHVGIYAGNGKIVEAQSKATGITNYRSVNCHAIICIRRVL